MSVSNKITIMLPGREPYSYDLGSFHSDTVHMGRTAVHGRSAGDPANDIAIDGDIRYVSRAQCTFRFENGRWHVTDDGSLNGLTYQGEKVRELDLNDGDKIYIGESVDRRLVMMFSSRRAEEQQASERVRLDGAARFVIGRSKDCDVVLTHPTVSRQHCIITFEKGAYYVADNNSTNGVVLNGRTLEKKTRLNQMDKITIADTNLFYNEGFLYFSEPSGGVSVSAKQLYKKVGKKGQEKFITNDVTLAIEPNEFVAIVGGSGAGKTTLLNCLSGMTNFTAGDVLINGDNIRTAGKSLRSLMGYVPQQDIVYDSLSLEHMLYYSAKLRMPKDTTPEEISAKIDETLAVVELSEHRKTMIKDLSGGQKKRASIAVELLASPKLFFLDEPSSGLDPGTEKHLMQMLKRLSDSGKTVLMVTHTVQNIDMCDRLICMGKGGVLCYSGPPSEAPAFFGKQRMTDIYDDLNDNAEAMAERFRRTAAFRAQAESIQSNEERARRRWQNPLVLLRQFAVMLTRYAEILKNGVPRLLLLLFLPVLLTFLVCLAFQADGGMYNTLGINIVRENFPFLVSSDTMSLIASFSCAAFWIGIFNSVQEISKERNIYERERFTGVAALPYLMSKFVMLTFLCLIQSAIMCAMLIAMSETTATVDAGQNAASDMVFGMGTAGVYFSGGTFWVELFLTTFLCVLSAMCLGLTISALVSNDVALVICPICLLPQILFTGIAAPLSGITDAISRVISCRWSCIAYLTSLDVNSLYTSCEFDNGSWVTEGADDLVNAIYYSDTEILFGLNPVASSWAAFGLICLVCLVAAALILRFRPSETR